MELQNSLKQLPSHSTASASSSPRAASSASAGATIPAVSSAAPTAAPALDTISGPEALVAAVAAAAAAASAGATASTTATSSSGPGPGFLYDGHGSEYAPGVQKKNVMVGAAVTAPEVSTDSMPRIHGRGQAANVHMSSQQCK